MPLETVSGADEGHGFFDSGKHADFLRPIEAFLACELAAGPAPESTP